MIIGIVMKPFLTSQITGKSLWKDLYIKQDFSDILSIYNATSIGIIPQSILLNRENSNDIDLSKENELTYIEKNHLISQINLCNGLILQGGLSSHKYEIFIAQYAIKHNIPILGICAGFNNIARAIGIKVEYNKELAKKHNIYNTKVCHSITIQKDAKILSQNDLLDTTFFVNSIHSMILPICKIQSNNKINIEAIAKDFEIEDISETTIEAFSVKNTKFCLAIKWHPELLPNDKITNIIFKKFVEACN